MLESRDLAVSREVLKLDLKIIAARRERLAIRRKRHGSHR